jgi:hypothetical protein
MTVTREYPTARSALSQERIPPSMYRRPPIVTAGQMPGTAQLAATAPTRLTPDSRSKIRSTPVCTSTAVSRRARSGQSCTGSLDSMTARHLRQVNLGRDLGRLPVRLDLPGEPGQQPGYPGDPGDAAAAEHERMTFRHEPSNSALVLLTMMI